MRKTIHKTSAVGWTECQVLKDIDTIVRDGVTYLYLKGKLRHEKGTGK